MYINFAKHFRERFADICNGKVKVPGLIVMKDVAIARSEFVPGERAITKIQDYQFDDVLFEYCCLPEVYTIFHLQGFFRYFNISIPYIWRKSRVSLFVIVYFNYFNVL